MSLYDVKFVANICKPARLYEIKPTLFFFSFPPCLSHSLPRARRHVLKRHIRSLRLNFLKGHAYYTREIWCILNSALQLFLTSCTFEILFLRKFGHRDFLGGKKAQVIQPIELVNSNLRTPLNMYIVIFLPDDAVGIPFATSTIIMNKVLPFVLKRRLIFNSRRASF